MRKIHNYRINKEDFWEMLHAKRHSPCLVITFRDISGQHTHKLSAGYGDGIDVYREGLQTYVLSHNKSLGYVGLQIFKGSEIVGEMFVEDHEVKETLGREGLPPSTIIKKMREFI